MPKRHRKQKSHKPQPRQQQKTAEVLPALDLSFFKASVVEPPEWEFCQIVLAGAGGTGSYMAQHIGRVMHSLYRMGKATHLTIIDPDTVKEENEGRSLFCEAERGMPKAETLARRYGFAWGLNTSYYVGEFDESHVLGRDLTVVVGCVDNARARRALHDVLKHNPEHPGPGARPNFWWLDCGNVNNSGRVLLGTAHSAESTRGAFSVPGKCLSLPSPAIQYPGLLEARPEEEADTASAMTCAQRAAANMQSLNINAAIAVVASDYLTRLLVTGDLKWFASEVNLGSCNVRSTYAIPEEVARASRKPPGYMTRTPDETGGDLADAEDAEMFDVVGAGL